MKAKFAKIIERLSERGKLQAKYYIYLNHDGPWVVASPWITSEQPIHQAKMALARFFYEAMGYKGKLEVYIVPFNAPPNVHYWTEKLNPAKQKNNGKT